eukprot:238796_1
MCKECCVEAYVDRGDTVHESGAYLVNFKKCAKCNVRFILKTKNKNIKGDEDKDEEVEITFDHHCSKCDHKICQHFYSYELDDNYHKYLMECALCGRGTHEQFAGIKQMYPKEISSNNKNTMDNKTNDDEKDDNKESDSNKNESENKKIVLNLSGMKQLNVEVTNDTQNDNDNNDDEWDD